MYSYARVTLDVVIEAAAPALVALQQAKGVVVGKVLELQQHVRPPGGQRTDELLNDRVICGARQPSLPASNQLRLRDANMSQDCACLPRNSCTGRHCDDAHHGFIISVTVCTAAKD
jgi:hypothetical protein